jgi:hypothetical protein
LSSFTFYRKLLTHLFPFKSKSFGLWRRVVLWQDTKVSEVHAASSFNSHFEDGVSIDLKSFYHTTALHGITTQQDLDLRHYRNESLKTHKLLS